VAEQILAKNGWTPYLEDEGALWLPQYLLAKNQLEASTFDWVFNKCWGKKPEFNEEQLLKLVNQFGDYNQNTLKKGFEVFIRTYLYKKNEQDIEDGLSGVLSEFGSNFFSA